MATVKTASRAVLYTRVSTGPQVEGTSLASQLLACRQKAAQMGAEVVGVYEDVQSGADYRDRHSLQAALAQIERGEANTLIIYDMTRYSRDLEHQQLIRKRLMAARARLEFATFEVGDLSSAESTLSFGVRGVFAQYERDNTRARTMRGKRNRAKAGVQTASAYRPIGYDIVTKRAIMEGRFSLDQLGKYVVREEEAKWVREIFKRYARGSSLGEVAAWMTLKGPAPRGGGKHWIPCSIRVILRNPLYKGQGTFGRRERVIDESRIERGLKKAYYRPRPIEEQITFEVPPIVEADVWQQCAEKLASNKERASGKSESRWMLTSLLRCPLCGSKMTPRFGKWHGLEAQKEAKENLPLWEFRRLHYSYKCRDSFLNPNKDSRCKGFKVAAGYAEDEVVKQVLDMASSPDELEAWLIDRAKSNAALFGSEMAECERLKSDLLLLQNRERNTVALQERALANNLDPSIYDSSLQTVVAERKKVESQIAMLGANTKISTGGEAQKRAKEMSELLDTVRKFFVGEKEEVTSDVRNKALLGIIERIEMEPSKDEERPVMKVFWKED